MKRFQAQWTNQLEHTHQRLQRAEKELRAGQSILIQDADSRENEVDFVASGAHISVEHLAQILNQGRGLLCAALTAQKARQLNLPLSERFPAFGGDQTHFSYLVDWHETRTGISASERQTTLRQLSHARSLNGFRIPGHVPTLLAHPQGLLGRKGHTEASTTLCQILNLEEVMVICEILDRNGNTVTGKQMLHNPNSIEDQELRATAQTRLLLSTFELWLWACTYQQEDESQTHWEEVVQQIQHFAPAGEALELSHWQDHFSGKAVPTPLQAGLKRFEALLKIGKFRYSQGVSSDRLESLGLLKTELNVLNWIQKERFYGS